MCDASLFPPCSPPGFGTPVFASADARATAYFAVRDAGFSFRVLAPLVAELDPLAVDLVRWRYAQPQSATDIKQ